VKEDRKLFRGKYRISSTRLKNWDYSYDGYYFVTVCTKDRICCFGSVVNGKMKLSWQGKIVGKYWHDLPNHYHNCRLDEFIVMPNHVHGHVHGIVIIGNNVETIHELSLQQKRERNYDTQNGISRRKMLLSKIIGRFKMQSAKEINKIKNTPGQPLWQPRFYDHIIRNEKSLYNIRKYISENSQKWELDESNPKNF
jgi:REP element-mobilizing transposase RayT